MNYILQVKNDNEIDINRDSLKEIICNKIAKIIIYHENEKKRAEKMS